MPDSNLKHAVEALLFASERPLTVKEIRDAFEEDLGAGQVEEHLALLRDEYEREGRGFRLFEIAGGWQLVSDPRFSSTLKRFYQSREKKRLTQASLETLAVIAYRQPVTRADVEFVRGVNVDGAIKTLSDRMLIRVTGRKEVPGRPILYGTTDEFLEYFGLKSLADLPPLAQFTEKDIADQLVPPQLRSESAPEDPGARETGSTEEASADGRE